MQRNYDPPGYQQSALFMPAPGGALQLVTGFNPTDTIAWLQLFELDAPAGVPFKSILVGAQSVFSAAFPPPGRPLSRCCFGVSTAGDTFVAAPDAWWFEAVYTR